MDEEDNKPRDTFPGDASEVKPEQRRLGKEQVWWFQKPLEINGAYMPLGTVEEIHAAIDGQDAYGNSMIFTAQEKEAWSLLSKTKGEWQRKDIRCIGWSDGSIFHGMLKESVNSVKADIRFNEELKVQKDEILERQKYLLRGEKITEEDERILQIPFKQAKTEKEMLAKNYNKAFKAECVQAIENRKNKIFRMPKQQNVVMPGADAETQDKILKSWSFK